MNELTDTTIFIDYLRGDTAADQFLNKQLLTQCSLITAAELIQGAADKKAQRITENLLSKVRIISISQSIGETMLRLMKLYAISHGLRIPDALIAATAMEENLTLVTANIKHFSFIKDLSLLDWKKERIEYSSRN